MRRKRLHDPNFDPVALLMTDLHLTEKAEDQYRFDIFPWVVENYGHQLKAVFITGDLTDRKNYHADWFVNKVVESIKLLAKDQHVFILKGNHDYDEDPAHPFFGFLGKYLRVTYVSEPVVFWGNIQDWSTKILLLPHTRNTERDWDILNKRESNNLKAIMMHQTFRGSISESGYKLDGISPGQFKRFKCPIFSGDVHVAQQIGPVTYVGCPYHINYGDQFDPRVLLLDKWFDTQDVYFTAPRKFMIDVKSSAEFSKMRTDFMLGDMMKVRVHLPRHKLDEWPQHRDRIRFIAQKIGVKINSITLKEERKSKRTTAVKKQIRVKNYKDTFIAFCSKYDVSKEVREAGRVFLESD